MKGFNLMIDAELDGALAAINDAAGPAPWFATQPPQRNGELLRWCCAARDSDRSTLAGACMLLDVNDAVVLVMPRYSYAQLIAPSRLLCWQSLEDKIVLRTFDMNMFETPFATSIDAARQRAIRNEMGWASGLVSEDELPRRTRRGRYVHRYSRDLEDVSEVLILAGGAETQLYRLLPAEREVGVYPQNWFNEGPYDFGYQWPMVVARSKVSDNVVGWGMRLGAFVLDSTLCNVKSWLYEDPFAYLPPTTRLPG